MRRPPAQSYPPARRMVATHIKHAQFISEAHVGSLKSGVSGEKLSTKPTAKKARVSSFKGAPNLPRLQRQCSSGPLRRRLRRIQPVLMK